MVCRFYLFKQRVVWAGVRLGQGVEGWAWGGVGLGRNKGGLVCIGLDLGFIINMGSGWF